MKIILLSGGAGSRLWPLSNDSRSKQFLKVIPNESGTYESMIQRIWKQLQAANLTDVCYISTNEKQVEIIQNHLGSKPRFIIEPIQRDTFPAISLAAAYLHSVCQAYDDEVVCVLPVDMYVDYSFLEILKKLELLLQQTDYPLGLIGVQPSSSSEQYGYIVPSTERLLEIKDLSYKSIQHFVEKPVRDTAIQLIQQGALWNCGVFGFKLSYMIEYLQKHEFPIQYDLLKEQYWQLPQKSFDYQVVEKAEKIAVVPYDGSWNDLGTWDMLTKKMDTQVIGNGEISAGTKNTHIVNELNLPVVVAGTHDSVIITSSDGILVAHKSVSGQLKELTKHLRQYPMYGERRWGWYRVLDHNELDSGNHVLTRRLKIQQGENLSYHRHFHRQEVWTIVSGEGELILDKVLKFVKTGDVITIPIGAEHGIKAITDLNIIEVQIGKDLTKEDISRIDVTWEELKSYL